MTVRCCCFVILLVVSLVEIQATANADVDAPVEPGATAEWKSLFNGRDLSGWAPKIRGYPTGEDPARTFRVEDGLLSVSYAAYDNFDSRFGHLFFNTPYTHYRLRLDYRFVGEQALGAPEWAYRNSGVMLHSQNPATMMVQQDFPISIEFQFLGGRGDGQARPTANVCSPGTHIVYQGEFTDTHCIVSSAPTFHDEQWVHVEVLVLGGERVVHYVNDKVVLEYGELTTGGGVVSGHRQELKPEGQPLRSGYIALQSEGHPIQFRNIELLQLGSD